ncbi:MAG TPA: hypothetical protein VG842_11475, partial [Sediminibacterium sp.]|nr:hypothetical protein [Sediminibacterium sp.]
MKIVVLDGYTLNPGDLTWECLQVFGELTVHDRTAADQVVERCRDASIIFTNKTPVNAAALRQLPVLRYIGVLATGYNIVDVHAAAERGIPVCNVPGYSTHSVAQLVFALVLELCLHAQEHSAAVRNG